MRKSKQYRRSHISGKVRLIRLINISLIIFMFGVVIYDSFTHGLPFYYILFILIGLITGRFVSATQKFSVKKEAEVLTVESNPIGIITSLVLIGIRFFGGKLILQEFHIVWTVDALYLLFIGIYYAQIKNIIRQIDERVYISLFEEK